ncbi:peptidase C14 [Hymenopellis radicata]|nr:peptidase C14 [Hymenopellis radicata]
MYHHWKENHNGHAASSSREVGPSGSQHVGSEFQDDVDRGLKDVVRHMFQYSKCTGRKKALCIGINYIGQKHELKGCINDARHVHDFLLNHCNYKNENIMVLTDGDANKRRWPTKANMLGAMRWLVQDAHAHDSLFFHYSGHGGRTRDLDGDEISGFDEVIYPMDYLEHGSIIDDILHDFLVRPLPMGCRLTALFDCCHSGTVLDLPFSYDTHGNLTLQVTQKAYRKKMSSADVICWSGSKDGQTSADTFQGGVAVGAMSYAFIKSLRANHNQSYQGLLKSVRTILYPRYSQTPQLGSSHRIDTKIRFII